LLERLSSQKWLESLVDRPPQSRRAKATSLSCANGARTGNPAIGRMLLAFVTSARHNSPTFNLALLNFSMNWNYRHLDCQLQHD